MGLLLTPAGGAFARTLARASAMAAAATLAVACGDGGVRASSPSASAAPASASAAPAPSVTVVPRSPEVEAAWREALAADDQAVFAELAARVGAPGLIDALEGDAGERRVALQALPLADRSDQAWGALGRALAAGRGDEVAVADAIEGVLRAERRDVELLDADGARACAEELRRVAAAGGRGSLPAARAESLARRVAERGGSPQ